MLLRHSYRPPDHSWGGGHTMGSVHIGHRKIDYNDDLIPQSFQRVKMQKAEARFTAEIKKSLLETHQHIIIQKHSDRFTSGIADLEIVYKGMTSWVEVKDWQTKIPKSNIHIHLVGAGTHQLSRLQEKFLLDRINCGIRGFGLFRVSANKAAMIPGNLLNDVLDTGNFERWNNVDKINGIWQLQKMIR